MEIVKIVIIAIVCSISCVLIKEHRPDLALLIAIAGSCMILIAVVGYLASVLSTVGDIVNLSGLESSVLKSVIKMIGIGYIAEFGAGACEDSGQKSIGDKLLLAAKIIIVAMSLPIITQLLKILSQLL